MTMVFAASDRPEDAGSQMRYPHLQSIQGSAMKLMSRVVPLASAVIVAAGLAGCAAAPAKSHDHAHASTGAMDMPSHCEMHRKMMSGKPSAEQQAMMQAHMKSMTPEMRQRMQAMHERCAQASQ
jgi:hypothetical protein